VRREFRLTRSTDFMRVRRSGKSYAHPLLVLIACPNSLTSVRVGVTASQSVGNAVQRNRAKRRLRACMDSMLPKCIPGWDIVILARRMCVDVAFVELQTAVSGQLSKANLLGKGDNYGI
jgi:ribonuclease P protein component